MPISITATSPQTLTHIKARALFPFGSACTNFSFRHSGIVKIGQTLPTPVFTHGKINLFKQLHRATSHINTMLIVHSDLCFFNALRLHNLGLNKFSTTITATSMVETSITHFLNVKPKMKTSSFL